MHVMSCQLRTAVEVYWAAIEEGVCASDMTAELFITPKGGLGDLSMRPRSGILADEG